MSITKERFESGLSYQAYKEAMTRNRERVEANEARVVLDPETVRALRSLPEDVRTRLQAELQKMRDETTVFANAEVQRELRELVTALPVR